MRTTRTICLSLTVLTLAAYSSVRTFDFVQWDDPQYPLNVHLAKGFTKDAVKWAFTSGEESNWHPLTWLSHLLDYQLFGPNPGPDHVVSLIFHVLASLMLFLFLRRATGTQWRSAFVAAIFALHPLHVQSVAWISERKDVLCAFFCFLTSWCWVRYTERQTTARYLLTLIPFCLGLMSKPMIVSLPVILLLFDLWPLRRLMSMRLLLEKVPFFLLSVAGAVITYIVQSNSGIVRTLEQFSLGSRVGNAAMSYWVYMGKTLSPTGLSFYYPYRQVQIWQAALAALALLIVTVLMFRCVRRFPYLTVGWLWFLITLVPVIGFVQLGLQARADRYMYIPMVGLTIMLAWGADDVRRPWVIPVLAAVCLACVPATWIQSRYWRNSLTLFSHATEVDPGNSVAWHYLGNTLKLIPGREPEALAAFDNEIKIDPGYAVSHGARAEVLWKLGRRDEALAEYREAIRLAPDVPPLRVAYGAALAQPGRWPEAIAQYQIALKADRQSSGAWYNLGVAEIATGRLDEAIADFGHALRIDPGIMEAHNNLGVALARQSRWPEAVAEYEKATRLGPDFAPAWSNLGDALIRVGRVRDAVEVLRHAVVLSPQDAGAYNLLGLAIAANSNTPEATAEAIGLLTEAIRLDPGLVAAEENLARLQAR